MVNILQDELTNLRNGHDVEDTNHYVIKIKGKEPIYSYDLDKPLTKSEISKLEWVSANEGMSNYRYWAANDKHLEAMRKYMGFVEYKKGVIVATSDKYIGEGIINNIRDWKVSRDFNNLTTHESVCKRLSEILEKQLGYSVEITINEELIDIDSAKAYASEISRLSRRYKLTQQKLGKIELGYSPKNPKEIGEVFYNHDKDEPKILRLTANKDNRDPKLAINNSRCDKSKLKYAPATHEFAHIIYQVRNNSNSKLFDFEIQNIYNEYIEEFNSYIQEGYHEEASNIFIGIYGHNKINDFIAEAFQEYRNCKKPSKYAEIVGKLIDEYFKR